jgi:hypothetical protein
MLLFNLCTQRPFHIVYAIDGTLGLSVMLMMVQ